MYIFGKGGFGSDTQTWIVELNDLCPHTLVAALHDFLFLISLYTLFLQREALRLHKHLFNLASLPFLALASSFVKLFASTVYVTASASSPLVYHQISTLLNFLP